jgi:hypothetical protein
VSPAPSAVAHAERILAACAAVLRLGALLLLAAAVPVLVGSPRAAAVAVAATVESALFAVLCLRAGALRRTWVALDLIAVALALLGTPGPVESPLFNFALVSVVIAGLPAWPWWATLLSAVPVAAATVVPALLSPVPPWTLLPDGSAPFWAPLIAWFVARVLRRSTDEYDRHRALIVQRAEVLARERERVRQSVALQTRLLGTLGDVVTAGAVTDPALAGQLDTEVCWLRRVVDVGLIDPPPDLAGGLRALVAEKSATGLRVVLDLPAEVPEPPAEVRQAVLDAAREALTNVAKHAGVRMAAVRVTVGEHLMVEIVDAGRGYDPSVSAPGTGQTGSIRRGLAEVSGTAEVHTAPGLGTRVVLRVPR